MGKSNEILQLDLPDDVDLVISEDTYKGLCLDSDDLDPVTGRLYKSVDHKIKVKEYLGK
jgi:hypothetical protein